MPASLHIIMTYVNDDAPPQTTIRHHKNKARSVPILLLLAKGIVYHAKIAAEDNGETRHYIGITATTFKERSTSLHRYVC
jgi:hypothetical protein